MSHVQKMYYRIMVLRFISLYDDDDNVSVCLLLQRNCGKRRQRQFGILLFTERDMKQAFNNVKEMYYVFYSGDLIRCLI